MNPTIAYWIWGVIGIYIGVGALFAVGFFSRRLKQSDPAAVGSTVGFRLIILPGVILLWPVLAKRWKTGASAPQEEHSPHRAAKQT